MKLNLYEYLESDLQKMSRIITQNDQNVGWSQIDIYAFERKFLDKNLIMVIYPELLQFDYVYREGVNGDKKTHEFYHTPWICCRVEFEGEPKSDNHLEILKKVLKWFDNYCPYKPFKDEDAVLGYFGMGMSPYNKDWTQYKIYFNPNFFNGWWENHTL